MNKENLWTYLANFKGNGDWFQIPFVFHNNVHKKRLGSKAKIKLDFLRSFDNPLLKYLICERVF